MKRRTRKIILGATAIAMILAAIAGGVAAALRSNVVEAKAYFVPEQTFTNGDAATYYNDVDESLSGTSLLTELRGLNSTRRKKTMGYSSGGTNVQSSTFIYTDYDTSDPTKLFKDSKGQRYGTVISSFYTYTPATSFNKEHVWPNTHGGSKVENDIHMARPTISSENSSRSHSYYVEGATAEMGKRAEGFDPAVVGYNADSKGESARIIFYCMVASDQLVLEAGHENSSKTNNNKMGDLNDLIKWNLEHPVTEREKNRNEGAEYLQGNRNPFIDHPEYACKIWGNTNETTKKLCGNQPTPTKTLTSISISGTPTNKQYVGNSFDSTGLIVTANFSDQTTADITSTVTWSPSVLALNDTRVTASYTYGSDTKTAIYSPIKVEETQVSVTGVRLNKASLTLDPGKSETLVATVLPDNAANKSVVWTSSNDRIATVLNGKVTAYNPGTAIIKAVTVDGGFMDICTVTVNTVSVESITAIPTEITLKPGDVGQIGYSILPANATDQRVMFEVDNDKVIALEEDGEFCALKDGTATITLTTVDGNKTAKCNVIVKNTKVDVESISLNEHSINGVVGEEITLSAKVLPENATNKTVLWKSNDSTVASVTQEGCVKFLKAGYADISVQTVDGNKTDTCEIEVKQSSIIPVESISLDKNDHEAIVGDTIKLTATIKPTNATNKNIRWSSTNNDIASVNNDGLVTTFKAGKATIIATSESDPNIYDNCELTVKEGQIQKTLKGIEIVQKPTKTVYTIGEELDLDGLRIEAYYSDHSHKEIENYGLSQIDMSTPGKKELLITYEESGISKYLFLNIMVEEKMPSKIEITSEPFKKDYYIGQTLILHGLKVAAIYVDGTKTDVTGLVVPDVNEIIESTSVVTISYGELTSSFTINVKTGKPEVKEKATDFAYIFEEKTDSLSDITQVTKDSWENLEYKFEQLDSATKTYLRDVEYDQSTSEVAADSVPQHVLKIVKEYDQVIIKKAAQGFKDFMDRNPEVKLTSSNMNWLYILIRIIMYSMVGVAALVTFIRIFKKD